MIGPLFGWELLRLARRGQAVRARGLFTLFILVSLVLCILWRFWSIPLVKLFSFGSTGSVISIEESASFGESFAMTFLFAQLACIIVLAPAYAAGGLAEEKERKSIDFLLVSDLSNREIVLGPFVARVLFLFAIVLSGLPILFIAFLYGGIDPQIVIASYGITFATIILIAAFSLVAAVFADSFRGAMFRAYGLTFLFAFVGFGCFYLSPLFVLMTLRPLRNESVTFAIVSIVYPVVELVIAMVMTIIAVSRLRSAADGPKKAKSDAKPIYRPLPVVASKKPAIGESDPYDWKERHCRIAALTGDEEAIDGLKLTAIIVVATFLAVFTCIGIVQFADSRRSWDLLGMSSALGIAAHLAFIGMMACGGINRERAKLTWESVLAVPDGARDLLVSKARNAFEKGWWLGVPCLLVMSLIAGNAGLLNVLATAVVLFAAWITAPLYALALSATFASTGRAFLFFIPFVVGCAFGPMLVWYLTTEVPFDQYAFTMLLLVPIGLIAFWSWWTLQRAVRSVDS